MEDLQSKEHYFYKINTLLMKSSAYLPFYRQPLPCMDYPPSLEENLDPLCLLWFKKNPNHPISRGGGGGSHYLHQHDRKLHQNSQDIDIDVKFKNIGDNTL